MLAYFFVFCFSFLVHAPLLCHFFLRDDSMLLILSAEPHALQKYFFYSMGSRIATLLAEYSVFKTSPAGYYAVNIVLHSVNSVLIGIFTENLLRHLHFDKPRVPGILTALCFAVIVTPHEATHFIFAGDQLWCALFYFLACLCYLKFLQSRIAKHYAAYFVFAVLAVIAKPAAVSLILFAFLLEVFLHGNVLHAIKRNFVLLAPPAVYFLFYRDPVLSQNPHIFVSHPSYFLDAAMVVGDALSDPVLSLAGFVRGVYLHGKYYHHDLFALAEVTLALKMFLAFFFIIFSYFLCRHLYVFFKLYHGHYPIADSADSNAFSHRRSLRRLFMVGFSFYFLSYLPYVAGTSIVTDIGPLNSFFSTTQTILSRYLYIPSAGFSMLFCSIFYEINQLLSVPKRIKHVIFYAMMALMISINALNNVALSQVYGKQGMEIKYLVTKAYSLYGKKLNNGTLMLLNFPSFFVLYHGATIKPLFKLLYHYDTDVFWLSPDDKNAVCSFFLKPRQHVSALVRVEGYGLMDGTHYFVQNVAALCKHK